MQSRNKVMQVWDSEAIRFMQDASEFGDYHEKLARILLPYLPRNGHVCDAGCGLGYLSLVLARYCREVTAVDISVPAISALREQILPDNLHVCCQDITQMSGSYDAMVFCYFGRTSEILKIAKKQCRGKVVIVKRNCEEHRFSLGQVPIGHTVGRTLQELDERHIPYDSRPITLEFGQPFRSASDALKFFELYNKSTEPIQEEQVYSQLISLGHPEFPLYLPSERKMELITLNACDIPEG